MPVDIRGKKYTTVAERIVDLHENTSGDYSIETEIVQFDADVAVIKATLAIGSNRYQGHAFERTASSQINKTSHLENCETSAIGRALAAARYGALSMPQPTKCNRRYTSKPHRPLTRSSPLPKRCAILHHHRNRSTARSKPMRSLH